jgi:hypothetical protein
MSANPPLSPRGSAPASGVVSSPSPGSYFPINIWSTFTEFVGSIADTVERGRPKYSRALFRIGQTQVLNGEDELIPNGMILYQPLVHVWW